MACTRRQLQKKISRYLSLISVRKLLIWYSNRISISGNDWLVLRPRHYLSRCWLTDHGVLKNMCYILYSPSISETETYNTNWYQKNVRMDIYEKYQSYWSHLIHTGEIDKIRNKELYKPYMIWRKHLLIEIYIYIYICIYMSYAQLANT